MISGPQHRSSDCIFYSGNQLQQIIETCTSPLANSPRKSKIQSKPCRSAANYDRALASSHWWSSLHQHFISCSLPRSLPADPHQSCTRLNSTLPHWWSCFMRSSFSDIRPLSRTLPLQCNKLPSLHSLVACCKIIPFAALELKSCHSYPRSTASEFHLVEKERAAWKVLTLGDCLWAAMAVLKQLVRLYAALGLVVAIVSREPGSVFVGFCGCFFGQSCSLLLITTRHYGWWNVGYKTLLRRVDGVHAHLRCGNAGSASDVEPVVYFVEVLFSFL